MSQFDFDEAIHSEIIALYVEDRRERNLDNKTWQTRDGGLIPIGTMTASHIKNAICMLQESRIGKRAGSAWRAQWVALFEDELSKRRV